MPSTHADDDPSFVFCRSCGAKVPADWSFCRSCQSSLENAVHPDERSELSSELYGIRDSDDRGCPKCDHTETSVEILETTGVAVTPRVAAQNDRFRVVSCTTCGYSELYRQGDDEVLVDLFLSG